MEMLPQAHERGLFRCSCYHTAMSAPGESQQATMDDFAIATPRRAQPGIDLAYFQR